MIKKTGRKVLAGIVTSLMMIATLSMTAFAGETSTLNASELTAGQITSATTFGDFTVMPAAEGGAVTIDSNKKSANGMSFTQRLKLGGAGTYDNRSVHFTTTGAADVTVYCMSSSSSEDRELGLYTADGTLLDAYVAAGASLGYDTVRVASAGEYYLAGTSGGVNVYYISVVTDDTTTEDSENPSPNPSPTPNPSPVVPSGDVTLEANGDGTFDVCVDGVKDETVSGPVGFGGYYFVAQDGVVDTAMNGAVLSNDTWYFVAEGRIVTEYVGFTEYDNEWFVVTNGVIDTAFSGAYLYGDAWFLIAAGQMVKGYDGLANYDNAWFVVDSTGRVRTDYNGNYAYNGGVFAIAAGQWVETLNGLWNDPISGNWYFYAGGQVQYVTQLTSYDGAWFYVVDGIFDTTFNGEVEYDGAKFQVIAGQPVL